MLVHHDADRLRRVPRSRPNLQSHLAQVDALAVGKQLDRKVDLGAVAVGNDGAGGGKLKVAGEKVGMTMRLDDPLDRSPAAAASRGNRDVAAGVNTTARPLSRRR